MSTLTPEAKEYAQAYLESLGRDEVVRLLEGICIACYDEEGLEELAEAAVDSVEAGDIEIPLTDLHAAQAAGHHVYMKWLDIDEVWAD